MQTEDIQALALPVLRHRLLTNFTAASEGVTTDTVVERLRERGTDAPIGAPTAFSCPYKTSVTVVTAALVVE